MSHNKQLNQFKLSCNIFSDSNTSNVDIDKFLEEEKSKLFMWLPTFYSSFKLAGIEVLFLLTLISSSLGKIVTSLKSLVRVNPCREETCLLKLS